MRKNSVLAIFLLCFFSVNAQRLDSLSDAARQQYQVYMRSRSTFKTMGLVLLGTGPALVLTAYLINSGQGWNGPPTANGALIGGLVATALSPVFLILAADNKRNAKLVLKREGATSAIFSQRIAYPVLALRINF